MNNIRTRTKVSLAGTLLVWACTGCGTMDVSRCNWGSTT
jgi:hypothetical protein